MSILGIINTLRSYSQDIILILIFLIILFFFFRDFKITNKNSWFMLLGFTAMGGFIIFRGIRRRKMLAVLERREKELEELEKKYEQLKKESGITKEVYEEAKARLDNIKKDAAESILQAEKEYTEYADEIRNSTEKKSGADILRENKELLNRAG